MFKLGEVVNNFSSKILESKIFYNPFIIAIVMTIIIVLVVYLNVGPNMEILDEDLPLAKIIARIGILVFIFNAIMLFISSNSIMRSCKKKYSDKINTTATKFTSMPVMGTVNPTEAMNYN